MDRDIATKIVDAIKELTDSVDGVRLEIGLVHSALASVDANRAIEVASDLVESVNVISDSITAASLQQEAIAARPVTDTRRRVKLRTEMA